MFDLLPEMAWAGIAILVGFIGLIWSADRFVSGAASIAEAFGIAPVIIGLTIVSFGTSAPEVVVSLIASIEGTGELAVGNAIGSNIANVGLVLGATLIISAIPVQAHLLKHEGAILLFITLISGYFLYDFTLTPTEGWILLGLLIPSMWYIAVMKQRDYDPEELVDDEHEHYAPMLAGIWFVVGLSALVLSSKVLVWGAETTALHFGISPLIIGLSVIAIGTSLPELAASITSAVKGHHDIAVGNIIGSNIFNILAVMSIPGIFGSPAMEASVFSRDYIAMLAVTLLIFASIIIVLIRNKQTAHIGKLTGVILLLFYAGYIYLLGQSQFA